MPLKKVRFNYFTTHLVPQGLPEEMEDRDIEASWNMTEMLAYLSVATNPLNGAINVGEYVSEFDRHTLINELNGIYSFQIAKLRETNISKKRLNNPKEDLGLRQDEYIGEFVTIVFDPRYCTLGVQSNFYSLNTNQVEIFLTELRNRYINIVGRTDRIPLMVSLRPIVDDSKVDRIGNADIFRKVTVKGSNMMADSLADTGSLEEVSGVIGRARGVKFELSLSVGNAPKTESLDHELVQEIIQGFREAEDKPVVEIAARQDEESPIDIVNLLSPRLTNVISLQIERRQSIGHEYIHREFMEQYQEQRAAMARILQPLEE